VVRVSCVQARQGPATTPQDAKSDIRARPGAPGARYCIPGPPLIAESVSRVAVGPPNAPGKLAAVSRGSQGRVWGDGIAEAGAPLPAYPPPAPPG
jgi:hypothetical protein